MVKVSYLAHLIISAALLLLFPPPGLAGSLSSTPYSLVPDREVVLINKNVPEWKLIWDEARRLTRSGDYQGAIERYEQLLSQKNNLNEARWELAGIHMHLEHWDKAAAILELLVEAEPECLAYLNGLGRVMWEKGSFERAVDLFKRAYNQNPDDATVLSGLVEGLSKLGRKREALPYLERLHRLQPENLGIHRYLAMLTYDLALYDKARALLVALADRKDADNVILVRTAQVHDRLGLFTLAADYWQRVLARETDQEEAHLRLADIFEQSGRLQEALPHLLYLFKQDGGNPALAVRIGHIYENIGQGAKALPYYESYLKSHADDSDVLRSVVKIYAAMGNKEKTLAALENYFRTKPESKPDDLKLAARLYDAAGRFHEAIPLYRQLIDISPEDPELLAALANDLLAIGENEGALSMWKHLTEVTDKPLPIYRSMADLLARLGRENELIQVLEAVHALDPADYRRGLELVRLYLDRSQCDKAKALLAQLTDAGCRSEEFYLQQGRLLEKLQQPEAALRNYLAVLEVQPENSEVRLKVARLSGMLGKIASARAHLDRLAASCSSEGGADSGSFDLKREQALVLQENGFFGAAIEQYRAVLDAAAEKEEKAPVQVWLGLAATYRDEGLYFEAEQTLRQALLAGIDRIDVATALFELALAAGDTDEAAVWLAELQGRQASPASGRSDNTPGAWRVGLFEARYLKSAGEVRAAIKKCQDLLAEYPASRAGACRQERERGPRLEIGLTLARFLLESGKLAESERVGKMLLAEGWHDMEILVLLQQIQHQKGDWQEERHYAEFLAAAFMDGNEEAADLGILLHLVSLYGAYGNPGLQYQMARIAAKRAPDSVRGLFLLGEAHQWRGEKAEALAIYKQILQEHPGNTRAQTDTMKLLYRTGKFEEALAYSDMILAKQPDRPDIVLLKARILWTSHKRKEALAAYESVMKPVVATVLAERLARRGIILDLQPRISFWNKITFTEGKPPELTEVVMSPSYVVADAEENRAVSVVAVPMYARYRWQKIFGRELEARRSVQRRHYNQAANQFEALIGDGADTETLLFDLAGLYSRLGRLGEESRLYERLQDISPDFPGLTDAIQRNRLKRRPQVSLSYGSLEEDGWDNHKAIEKKWGEVALTFSPRPRHEFELNTSRIHYQSTNIDQTLWSQRSVLHYRTQVLQGLNASMGIGVETLEDGLPDTLLFSFSVLGKIGDTLKGRAGFTRDVTADTIASLQRNIVQKKAEAGLSVDFFPRLIVGGDCEYTDFSDGNNREKYSLWSSYIFFFEPTLLQLSYYYDFKNSAHGPNPGGVKLADGFAANDHPYYVPHEYSLTRFSLFFKHQISDDTLDRGVPTYYTLEYTLGYDTRGEDLQAESASFFVELSKSFIVKASARLYELSSFRSKELFLSVGYRW